MSIAFAPIRQRNHKYINRAIDQWLDIHYGDTSFNGNAVIGYRKGKGVYTMSVRPLTEVKQYIKLVHASTKLDYYITANTVKGTDRKREDLFGLQNIVIDVDWHSHRNASDLAQLFVWYAKRDLWNTGVIPKPNSIVYTGRGVQLWWAIVPCYGGKGYDISLYHHNKIKNTFMNHLEALIDRYSEELEEPDFDRGPSSNLVGYFRIPCTFNTKAGRYGSLEILHTERYDQRELTLIPDLETEDDTVEERGQVLMSDSDREVLRGYSTLGARRIMRLIKLRSLRDSEIGSEKRDYYNFIVYNALRMSFDHEEAMIRLRLFNAGFKQPMSESELENCVGTAKKKGGYKCGNAKLIEWLEITPDEQYTIGLFVVRKKPNASRDEVRSALKADRDIKIQRMKADGVSQAEIARILGIGKNTVYRVLKKLKEKIEKIVDTSVGEVCHHFGAIYVLNTNISPEATVYDGGLLTAPIFKKNSS